MKFLNKCSKTNSSKPIWNKINQTRTGKVSSSIPSLKMHNVRYETDSEKAKIMSNVLKDTFTNTEMIPVEQEEKVDTGIMILLTALMKLTGNMSQLVLKKLLTFLDI
jgi:hypothetical protein